RHPNDRERQGLRGNAEWRGSVRAVALMDMQDGPCLLTPTRLDRDSCDLHVASRMGDAKASVSNRSQWRGCPSRGPLYDHTGTCTSPLNAQTAQRENQLNRFSVLTGEPEMIPRESSRRSGSNGQSKCQNKHTVDRLNPQPA